MNKGNGSRAFWVLIANPAEEGAILLVVLLIFMLVSIMGLSLIEVAGMERHMSHNNLHLLQAGQAADGGVAWACESIYAVLLTNATQATLPDKPLEASPVPVEIGEEANQASFKIMTPGVSLIKQGSHYCIYEFDCEGSSAKATQRVRVRVKYCFDINYRDDGGFDSRSLQDYGKITVYEP